MELVRGVPKDLRGQWEIQWFEDGTPSGHAMAPVGKYLHEQADEIERLTNILEYASNEIKDCNKRIAKLEAEKKRSSLGLKFYRL